MRLLFTVLVFLALLPPSEAAPTAVESIPWEHRVEAFFEPDMTVLDVMLTVDHMIDPSLEPDSVRNEIDELAKHLIPTADKAVGAHSKLTVLRQFLNQSGPWNGNRAFAYDLADPLGKKHEHKRLSHYLRTRLGNCITMPMLVLVLGRRIGLNMTLAVAPFHSFVKFTDDRGREWNLEATSGSGYTRDQWYRKNLPMTETAITKGTYLRALSEEENKALIASILIDWDMASDNPERAITTANILLKHAPRSVSLYLWRGSAYAKLLQKNVLAMFPNTENVPPEIRIYADALLEQNLADFQQAEALGWTEQDGVQQ